MAAIDMLRGRQTATRTLTNKSGGAVALGDVVVIGDGSTDNSFTTTTSAAYNTRPVGVAMEAIANNAAGLVALQGYVPKVNSAAGLTREHFLYTSTVAKEATGSASYTAGAFGMVLESVTDPEAYLFGGMPVQAAGGAPPNSYETLITADVTLTTAGTKYTVTSKSLAAGTYLVTGTVLYRCNTANTSYCVLELNDGGATVYWATELNVVSNNGQVLTIPVAKRVTLGGTVTLTLSATAGRNGDKIMSNSPTHGGTGDVTTGFQATAVTSA